MRTILPLVSALLLSACGAQGLGAMTGACGLGSASIMPVQMLGEAAVVSAVINDRAAHLLLDTGAERSVINAAAASVLGVMATAGPPVVAGAIGGRSLAREGVIERLQVGDQRITGLSVAIVPAFEFDGVLGLDVLSRYEVELDLSRGVAVLHRGTLCPGALPPMQGSVLELPAVRGVLRADGRAQAADPYMMVPISLDGAKALAMMDSGSIAGSLTSASFAGLAGVDAAALEHDPTLQVRGFGPSASMRRHRFGELLVGREVFRGPELLVGGAVAGQIPVIIGADYFHSHRVWLDFPGQRVFVVPIPPQH